ncbi:MAG: glutamyl-tRNA reductase [Nitriliruptor sp.]|nr:MAG: glutamyl-tRNA reductase [Nitriliruptor sp.]
MALLVVGCNHRSAELGLLERIAVPVDELPKALHSVVALEHVTEAVIVSTCNRVEVYAQVTRFHPGLQEVRGWLAERGDIHPQDLDALQYSYHDDRAAAHLFAVAGGLDSMVVGERQIAVQVKHAMEVARGEGTARRVLQRVFSQAVSVGRRIRNESRISEGASSMVDVGLAAVDASRGIPLAGSRVAVVGAGDLGGLAVRRVADLGAGHVTIWNRSPDKAERLATKLAGTVSHAVVSRLDAALVDAEVVVCTTGAANTLIGSELVQGVLEQRRCNAEDRATGTPSPLVLLDLGVPRNVDPACARLPGVELIDVSDVRRLAVRGHTGTVLADARRIVEEEVERFAAWTRAAEVEPTIRAIRTQAETVRQAELERLRGKLATLDDQQRAAVDSLTRGIVNTLLHHPTVRLKELADLGGADPGVELLRELFDLPEGDA